MATLEFIEKRIAGKEKEIEKLSKKIERIEKAKASGWDDDHNPYMYNESDLRRANKDLDEAKKSLDDYLEKLQQEKEKAQSRNVPAILEFLENWKQRLFEYYNEGLIEAFAEKKIVRELSDKKGMYPWGTPEYETAEKEYKERHHHYYCELHGYFRDLTPEERKLPQNRYQHKVKVKEGKWEYLKDYYVGTYEESIAKLKKDLDREANRKYDFIIERTNNIVGQITDASALRVGEKGDLNGNIKGTKGVAHVETIGAGGYAVQCFHFRTLISPVKQKTKSGPER